MGSLAAQAKTIIVTDIDDTIKVSHATDIIGDAPSYATDSDSRFLGMSEALYILQLADPTAEIIYLSNAPRFLVKEVVDRFLKLHFALPFKQGEYIPRPNLTSTQHKLINLRRIIRQNKPDTLVLIGDNGEKDVTIYHQIINEFKKSKVKILSYIHVVYSAKATAKSSNRGSKLFPEQIGFVSAIELVLDLQRHSLVSERDTQELIRQMAPIMAKEEDHRAYGELVFPYFMDCSDFVWKWNAELEKYKELDLVYNKLKLKCGKI